MDPFSVKQSGYIEKITDDFIFVKITVNSACSACSSKVMCIGFEIQDRIIKVKNEGHNFSVGEEVEISIEQTTGFKAIVYAYLFPFIIFMVTFFLFYYLTSKELLSAIVTIFVLAIYFGIIYYLRDIFEKKIKFHISPKKE